MAALPAGTVVATLRMPLPINDGLVKATSGLEELYGVKLHLNPTDPDGGVFVEVAVS